MQSYLETGRRSICGIGPNGLSIGFTATLQVVEVSLSCPLALRTECMGAKIQLQYVRS